MKIKILMILTLFFILGACKPAGPSNQDAVTDNSQLIKLFGNHIVFDRCKPSEFKYTENIKISGVQNEEGIFIYYDNSDFRLFERLNKTSIVTEAFLNNDAVYVDFKGTVTGWMLDCECAGRYYSRAFFSKQSDVNIVVIEER